MPQKECEDLVLQAVTQVTNAPHFHSHYFGTLFYHLFPGNQERRQLRRMLQNGNYHQGENKTVKTKAQGCHSEFGSNKVRKMVRQGKEKRLLARIFKILGKARKRLSRQNSTIKVRKCEEKRPEFTKKARKRLSRQNSTRKVRKCEEK